ncbi:hypothetical protein [Polyangium sp. 6x1]|uniref:hypothetical protein n=1 Tax=Polyangium sp. 6x1 TaxID=3042689 RepID=UPI002482A3DA|nr:hypothetical protein [Polyangium sp. 6x1]MDI1451806.1 hypothetical protein [Polyangium sp. 6x1]
MKSNRLWGPKLAAFSLVALTGLVACGGDGDGSGGAGASGGSGGQAGAGGEGGAGGGGMGGAGGGGMNGFAAIVMPSSLVVLEADNGGALAAGCGVRKDGMAYGGPFTSKVTVSPEAGVVENGGKYTFAEAGIFTVGCEVVVEGHSVTAETQVSVLNEAITPLLAKAGAGISGVQNGVHAVLAANGGSDQALKDAVLALDASLVDLDPLHYADLADVLRKIPGDYPTAADLTAAGVAKSADDDSAAADMDALAAALAELRTTIASIDSNAPKAGDEAALAAKSAAVESAVQKLAALEPTAHGVIENRSKFAVLVRDQIAPTGRAVGQLVSAVAKAEAAPVFMAKGPGSDEKIGGGKSNFGFLSLTLGMFNQNMIQMQMINKMYGKWIEAIDKSLNNLILIQAIDYLLPPNPEGPVIEMMYASSSMGFSKVGYDTWVHGHGFNSDPNFNIFIIIGEGWQTIAENVFTACGVGEANTLPEMVDTVEQCIKDVTEAAQNSLPTNSMEVIEPGLLADQDIHMGAFPEACSSAIPLAIGIIPVNLAAGRGPIYKSNCIK